MRRFKDIESKTTPSGSPLHRGRDRLVSPEAENYSSSSSVYRGNRRVSENRLELAPCLSSESRFETALGSLGTECRRSSI